MEDDAMIDILHRYSKAVLYHSETAQTIAEAVAEAITKGSNLSCSNLSYSNLRGSDLSYSNLSCSNLSYSNLSGSNLSGSDLRGSDLSYSNLSGSDLSGSALPDGYRIASLCFGGWGVTITPTDTQIGCERHPNTHWLSWAADAPEIAAMHSNA